MAQPESKVKSKIKEYMKKLFPNAWSFMPVQMGYGSHGIPDHIYCVPITITKEMVGETIGTFVGIEAKTATGRLSDYQRIQGDGILDASGLFFVIYGIKDIEDKLSVLERFK